jgi:hypothetical protein
MQSTILAALFAGFFTDLSSGLVHCAVAVTSPMARH